LEKPIILNPDSNPMLGSGVEEPIKYGR